MKISIQSSKKNRGGVLLATLIFVLTTAAIAITYLAMIQNSDQLIARSQSWNDSLAVAESGVEEAMAGINSAAGFTSATRQLNGASYSAKYYAGSPGYILSTGMVTVPLTGDTVSRRVKVTVQTQTLSMVGMGAVGDITLNGKGPSPISVDSWNSHDPTESNNGLYNGYVGTNGSAGSEMGIVSLGNHVINGNLYLGPSASYSSAAGQVTGTIYSDWNINFPVPTLPTTDTNGNSIVWTPAPTVLTNGALMHDLKSSGYYLVNDSDNVTVESGVTVTLNVQQANWTPTALNINGGTTNSGTVKMYLQSGNITLAGNSNGGASGNRPENLWVFGMPGVTGITYSGTSSFVGVIYAPDATLTLNGGGNNNNLIGAVIVNSVTLNGHYDFHYDTSLGTNGPSSYVVSSWQEF
jgi:hypothetical protein